MVEIRAPVVVESWGSFAHASKYPSLFTKLIVAYNRLSTPSERAFWKVWASALAFSIKMENLVIEKPKPGVAVVWLNRPKKLNAVSFKMFDEIKETFETLEKDRDVRVIVLAGKGKAFTAGIDLNDFQSLGQNMGPDPARIAINAYSKIKDLQNSVNAIEDCGKPVIAAVSGYCLGAGVDIVSACDIRYASKDSVFSIKEVFIGLTADLGTLQRLPKVVKSDSWVRELAYTGRDFGVQEAMQQGLLSRSFESSSELMEASLQLAEIIAEKSPVAILGCKRSLVHGRDHSVKEGMEFIANWNSWATQAPDLVEAIVSRLQKKKPNFPKL